MALTPSTMLELGTAAPSFNLKSADGTRHDLAEKHIDAGLLVIFMCNHCPYVKHIRERLAQNCRRYQQQGIQVYAINSNNADAYPDDGPSQMAEEVRLYDYPFAYLVDGDQRVAKAYRAACTPDFFLFDKSKRLVYRGQFDDARPGNEVEVTGADLTAAVDALVAGEPIPDEQKPSMGCNIKWKPGNEPDYFGTQQDTSSL